MLTDLQRKRYRRNILLPEVGEAGQERLLASRVLVIGAGGLGSPVALYLAAAGVGTLGIVDFDRVDLSNLQRQIMHRTADVGAMKVDSARRAVEDLNPDVRVVTYPFAFNAENAPKILSDYDIVVDATDSSKAKFLINDVCVAAGKPLVHGAINQFSGNVMTILPGHATYRDLFQHQPAATPSSETFGIIGAVAGTIGTIQATEVIKYLLGITPLLTDCILTYNARTTTLTKFQIHKGK